MRAPETFAMGLRATWKGVSIVPDNLPNDPLIEIDHQEGKYSLYRPVTGFTAVYKDFIDCLNETLLQLAYEMMRLLPDWRMLHCSAVSVSGVNTIAFGEKRSGKSVWAFEQALNKGLLLADDLLAWNPEKSQFICFGQASRLRRPVNQAVFDYLDKSSFIAGESLTYIKHTALNIAPCGYRFEPDRILEVEAGSYRLRTLSIRDSYARLVKGCIPAERFYPCKT